MAGQGTSWPARLASTIGSWPRSISERRWRVRDSRFRRSPGPSMWSSRLGSGCQGRHGRRRKYRALSRSSPSISPQVLTDKLLRMFKRQRTGSVVCASCGSLVGVNDDKCYSCGRRNPGPVGLRAGAAGVGQRPRVHHLVLYGCIGLYIATLLVLAGYRRKHLQAVGVLHVRPRRRDADCLWRQRRRSRCSRWGAGGRC